MKDSVCDKFGRCVSIFWRVLVESGIMSSFFATTPPGPPGQSRFVVPPKPKPLPPAAAAEVLPSAEDIREAVRTHLFKTNEAYRLIYFYSVNASTAPKDDLYKKLLKMLRKLSYAEQDKLKPKVQSILDEAVDRTLAIGGKSLGAAIKQLPQLYINYSTGVLNLTHRFVSEEELKEEERLRYEKEQQEEYAKGLGKARLNIATAEAVAAAVAEVGRGGAGGPALSSPYGPSSSNPATSGPLEVEEYNPYASKFSSNASSPSKAPNPFAAPPPGTPDILAKLGDIKVGNYIYVRDQGEEPKDTPGLIMYKIDKIMGGPKLPFRVRLIDQSTNYDVPRMGQGDDGKLYFYLENNETLGSAKYPSYPRYVPIFFKKTVAGGRRSKRRTHKKRRHTKRKTHHKKRK